MSHFTKSELGVADKESFKRTLKALGATRVGDAQTILDYNKQEQKVAAAGYFGDYAVGIIENANGSFDLVADWWGVHPRLSEKIKKAIPNPYTDHYKPVANYFAQQIAVDTIKATYGPQGFNVVVAEQKDGSVDIDIVRNNVRPW